MARWREGRSEEKFNQTDAAGHQRANVIERMSCHGLVVDLEDAIVDLK